jgi:DNA-binding MarR family transcriptional regulator
MADSMTVSLAMTHEVRDTCLCLHAQRAARVLARRFDEVLRPFGLTNEQFSLLMTLNRPEPAAMGDIAALLGADRTTLTAALKTLSRRRLARIGRDPADSRVRLAGLTPEGRKRLALALPAWQQAHQQLEAGLAAPGPDQIRRGLNALAAAPSR